MIGRSAKLSELRRRHVQLASMWGKPWRKGDFISMNGNHLDSLMNANASKARNYTHIASNPLSLSWCTKQKKFDTVRSKQNKYTYMNEFVEISQKQSFHVQSHHKMLAREKTFYGVPSAYRKHREDRYKDKNSYNHNHNGTHKGSTHKSDRRRNRIRSSTPTSSSASSSSSKVIHSRRKKFEQPRHNMRHGKAGSNNRRNEARTSAESSNMESSNMVKKKITSLQAMDGEVQDLIQNYEKLLGTSAFYASEFPDNDTDKSLAYYKSVQKEEKKEWIRKNSLSGDNSQSRLIQSEDDYMKICIRLRQLAVKWARLRIRSRRFVAQCLSSGENQSNTKVNLSSLPAENALNNLILLENLRIQRAELINATIQSEKDLSLVNSSNDDGIINWFQKKINTLTSSNTSTDPDIHNKMPTVLDLSAHISPKYTTNIVHYNIVMRSFTQWKDHIPYMSAADKNRQFISNLKHLESILLMMGRFSDEGNPNCAPDRSIYHILMLYYQLEPTLKNSLHSLDLLLLMIEKKKQGSDPKQWPNRHSYNFVISAFTHVVRNSKQVDDKLKAFSHVEQILSENEFFEVGSGDDRNGSENDTGGPYDAEDGNFNDVLDLTSPPDFPYYVTLQLIGSIGKDNLPGFFDRIDKLMIRMMGKEAYHDLCTDEGADLPKKVDCKILSNLVYYFCSSNDQLYLERAKIILSKMQDMRNQYLTQNENMIWDATYPDYKLYNSLILGLLHSAIEALELKRKGGNAKSKKSFQSQVKKDAMYATGLLDAMIENESSTPSRLTFYRLLRLWSMCKSKESGERSEEILSRMNILTASTGKGEKLESVSLAYRTYQAAIECWNASAIAQYPGAAQRAVQLLDRFNAQYGFESLDLVESDDDIERRNKDKGFLYASVLRCCADTSLESDKKDALTIAFDIYNRMQDEQLAPAPFTFVLLLQCCHLAPTLDQQRNLSKYVFDTACENGAVSQSVLSSLRRVNLNLFQSYEKQPEHTKNIRAEELKLIN